MVQRSIVCLSILAMAPDNAAHARTIPLIPEYGARGPMQICEGDIGIDVEAGEAVHTAGPVLRVINDRYLIAMIPSRLPSGHSGSGMEPVRLDNGLVAHRYDGASPEGAKDAPLALGDQTVRYLVVSRTGSVLIVGATLFDGSRSDRTILSRLRGKADSKPCIRAFDFASARADPAAAGFASYAEARHNALYPEAPDRGPGYYCAGGIGFRVEPGETLRRPWHPLRPSDAFLSTKGVQIGISGPRRTMKRVDPDHAAEHPMSLLHESRIIHYPSRGIGPPYSPSGVREPGSWHVELGEEQNAALEIAFPAGEGASAGFRFLERLEFVGPADSRCKVIAAAEK